MVSMEEAQWQLQRIKRGEMMRRREEEEMKLEMRRDDETAMV